MKGDQVRVTVSVDVAPATAFEIFTREIDLWWRRGPKYRHAGGNSGFICIEPHVGGRLFESIESEGGTHVFEAGRVSVWEPPARLVFSWRNATFSPSELTEVEVVFAASATGTLVTVTHRGWASLRADHPARHRLQEAAFVRTIGMWWGEQLTSFREVSRAVQERAGGPA